MQSITSHQPVINTQLKPLAGCTIEEMFRPEIRIKIEQEFANAAQARFQGFEGRARVCARRAVGAAIRAYLEHRGLPLPGPSAMDLLEYLKSLPNLPEERRRVVSHLLERVDQDFALPQEIDLLAEARWLVDTLEQDTGEAGL